MNFIKPQAKRPCLNFSHVSQLVRSTVSTDQSYLDSYYYCSLDKRRITKRQCVDCKNHKPILTQNEKQQ